MAVLEVLDMEHYNTKLALHDALEAFAEAKGVVVTATMPDGSLRMIMSTGLTNMETAWMLSRCLRQLHDQVDEGL